MATEFIAKQPLASGFNPSRVNRVDKSRDAQGF